MHLETRVLVTGGAGFLGSHLCERLLRAGREVLCVDNFFTGAGATSRICSSQPHFELHAPRRDLSALCRGRRDLQSRLPGVADPLSARPRADDEDQRARRHQHAGAGQAPAAPGSCRPRPSEVYGDPDVHPQTEDYWGHVNPIGPRSCYDEGKRCAETLFFDYHRQHKLRIKVARIFNTYGPRMHPNDGRVVSNFIVQALRGRDITIYGDGAQTRSFCYVDDLIDGLIRLMRRGDGSPARSIWAIRANSPIASWRPRSSISRARGHAWCTGRCRRTIRASAARTYPGQGSCWAGAAHPAGGRTEANHRLFRGAAAGAGSAGDAGGGEGLSVPALPRLRGHKLRGR